MGASYEKKNLAVKAISTGIPAVHGCLSTFAPTNSSTDNISAKPTAPPLGPTCKDVDVIIIVFTGLVSFVSYCSSLQLGEGERQAAVLSEGQRVASLSGGSAPSPLSPQAQSIGAQLLHTEIRTV